jgi:sodium/bile acid cotransporter 7
VAVPVAAAFPNIACTGGLIKPEITIFWCVIIGIFFVEGLSLPTTEMIVALPRFKFHAATQIYNLVFVPCVIFLVCKLMSNNSPLSALHDGFFALAAVPTTTSMCVMLTGKAGGNKALAAINAVLGNILAILVTPLLLGIFTTVDPELSHGALVLGLCFKMLVPLSLGQIARARLGPSLEQHMTKVTRCQQCLLVLLLFQILSDLFKSSGAVSGAIFMQVRF